MSDYLVKIVTDLTESQKAVDDFAKQTTQVFNKLAGLGAIIGVGFSLKSAIDQAADFQQAVKQLEVSLAATGQASQRTVKGFVDFAAGMQQVTKFSDDAVLATASLIQNIAQLSQNELKQATKAALDLSVAIGVDAAGAAALLGKAANGNVSALKRYGIEIQKGATDAETFANTLKVLETRFGGAAEKSVNTFSGAISQLQNNANDTLKTFGLVIIENESVIKSIQDLSKGFIFLTEAIQNNKDTISGIITFVSDLAKNLSATIPILAGVAAGIFAFNVSLGASALGFQAITYSIAFTTAGLASMAVAAAAALVPLLPFIAIGAAVGGLVAFTARVIAMRDSFASLTDAIVGTLFEVTSIALRFVGATNAANSLDKSIEKLKNKKVQVDASAAIDSFEELNRAAKSYRANLDDTIIAQRIAAQKVFEQQKSDNLKLFEESEKALKNAGKNQIQILLANRAETLKIIEDAERLGNVTRKRGQELILASEAEFQLKIGDVIDKQRQKQLQEQEKQNQKLEALAKEGSSSIDGFIKNFSSIKSEMGGSGAGLAAVGAAASAVKDGADGARKAVVGALTAGATAVLGPMGQALGPVFDLLSQGPEKVKEFINQFADALPLVIENIITAIPVVMDALAEKAPEFIQKLTELAPRLAASIAFQMSLQMPLVAVKLSTSLVAQTPAIAKGFVDSLVTEAGRFIQAMIDGIKGAFGDIGNSITGGGGGILKTVATGGLNKVFKFATGGTVVPGGFPNDSMPIQVQSGEGVARADTMARLDRFLQSASIGGSSSGGISTLIVKAVLGEQEVATAFVNLKRQGYNLGV